MAALLTTIKIMLPSDLVPDWVNGPVVMFFMLGATAVTGLTAMAEPFTQVLSAVSHLDVLACLSPIVPILKAASGPLGKRLERIFQNRSKKKAQEEMHKEKADKHGDAAHAIVYRACVICDEQFDEQQGVFCCGVAQETEHANCAHSRPQTVGHMHNMGVLGSMKHLADTVTDEAKPPHFTCSGGCSGSSFAD